MTAGRVDQVTVELALRNHEGRLINLENSPIVRWIVVGTYPDDPGTSPDSPPFENGVTAADGYGPVAFARNLAGFMHFEGGPVIPDPTVETVMWTITDPVYIPLFDVPGLYGSPTDPTVITTVVFKADGTVVYLGHT